MFGTIPRSGCARKKRKELCFLETAGFYAGTAAGSRSAERFGGFGAPASSGGFGGFGALAPASSSAAGFGGFGAAAPQPAFGAAAPQPAFGAPAASSGFGPPGMNASQAGYVLAIC